MSKKETVKIVPPVVEEKSVANSPLFESEAYGSPQPDAGMETTVLKTIGIGAPVPIVAPKHNTIQLQPIIVPIAVVPYMTQDSDILRADSAPSGGQFGYGEYPDAEFSKSASASADKKTVKNKKGAVARVCAVIVFLFAAVQMLFFLLAKFAPNTLGLNLAPFNVIDALYSWIAFKIAPVNKAVMILYSIAAAASGLLVLVSLLSLIFGKYPYSFVSVLALLSAAPVGAALIYEVVKGTFDLNVEMALIVLTAISVVLFFLSVILVLVASKKKRDAEMNRDDRRVNFESDNLI